MNGHADPLLDVFLSKEYVELVEAGRQWDATVFETLINSPFPPIFINLPPPNEIQPQPDLIP